MKHFISVAHILFHTVSDKFGVASRIGKLCCFILLPQDEFRQWFRAKVHVMLAPGKKPFDSLASQPESQVTNGDGDLGVSAVHEDCYGQFSQRQLVQVL